MVSLVAILLVGFFLGMRHATDPDHVIAVTTIVSRQRTVWRASLIGAVWGTGHTLTIFCVGTAIIFFRLAIPARLGLAMELSVGLMLILLGVLSLTGILRRLSQDVLPAQRPDHAFEGLGVYQVLRPLLIGIVHGLAGSAAVALLVMTTIRNPLWAVGYLLVFGLGTIAGMMLITTAIAAPFAFTADRFQGFNRGLATASGVLSLGFGLFLSYQIGFIAGLLTRHPQWTPH